MERRRGPRPSGSPPPRSSPGRWSRSCRASTSRSFATSAWLAAVFDNLDVSVMVVASAGAAGADEPVGPRAVCGARRGDEFAMLVMDGAAAPELAERCRLFLRNPVTLPRSRVPVSASFGLVQLDDDQSAATVLAAADLAMYVAKGRRSRAGAGAPPTCAVRWTSDCGWNQQVRRICRVPAERDDHAVVLDDRDEACAPPDGRTSPMCRRSSCAVRP